MKGINFTEPLFRKAVSGEKTQTRRIMKEQPVSFEGLSGGVYIGRPIGEKGFIKPRYRAGEILYLKEPYAVLDDMILYRYGSDGETTVDTWQNELFMPEKYARYYIKIKNVRVERLQDISDEDCIKEGIFVSLLDGKGWVHYDWMSRHVPASSWYHTPRLAYEALICKINGNNTWDSNPFVWVYDFKFTNKP